MPFDDLFAYSDGPGARFLSTFLTFILYSFHLSLSLLSQVLHLRPHQLKELLATASDDVNIFAPHRFLPFPHPDDFAKGFFESMKSITGGLRKVIR